MVVFSKNCVATHVPRCSAVRRRAPSISVQEFMLPLFNMMEGMRPIKAINVVRENCGVSVPYYTSWRALCHLKAEIYYETKDSIQYLDNYLKQLQACNS